MLAGYLQNGESLIMKKANQLWRAELFKLKVPFKQVNFVHDEWVVETYPQYADTVSEVLAQAIVDAGIYFKLNCPLAGSGEVGKTWYDIH
jgi:DNA polymerase-1